MASSASLVAFVVDQLGPGITAKRMFGEYGIYRDGVLIALFCDDQLFLKPTQAARELLGQIDEAAPYPGAKPAYRIPDERWDDAESMAALAMATFAELSTRTRLPKAKRKPARKKPSRGRGA